MDLIGWFTDAAASLPLPLVWGLGALFSFLESGLGLGFFLPCETVVLILSATFDSPLKAVVMFACVAVFASAGDHVGFVIGRRFGTSLRETRLIRRLGQGNWDRAVAVLEKRGAWAVFLTRMVPVVRTLTPAAAGVAGVRYAAFLPASLAGAAMWSALYVGVGFLARSSLDAVQKYIGNVGWVLAGVAVAVAAAVVIVKVLRKRRAASGTEVDSDPVTTIGGGAQLVLRDDEPGRRIPRDHLAQGLLAVRALVVAGAAAAASVGAFGVAAILMLVFVATKPLQWRLRRRSDAPPAAGTEPMVVEPVFDRVTAITVAVAATLRLGLPPSIGLLLALPEVLLAAGSLLAFRRLLPLPVTVPERVRSLLQLGGLTILFAGFGLGGFESLRAVGASFVITGILAFFAGIVVAYIVAVQYSRAMLARWQTELAAR